MSKLPARCSREFLSQDDDSVSRLGRAKLTRNRVALIKRFRLESSSIDHYAGSDDCHTCAKRKSRVSRGFFSRFRPRTVPDSLDCRLSRSAVKPRERRKERILQKWERRKSTSTRPPTDIFHLGIRFHLYSLRECRFEFADNRVSARISKYKSVMLIVHDCAYQREIERGRSWPNEGKREGKREGERKGKEVRRKERKRTGERERENRRNR